MITTMRPYILEKQCGKCGECVTLCPYDVFRIEEDNVVVACPEDCIECTACMDNCPREAISLG